MGNTQQSSFDQPRRVTEERRSGARRGAFKAEALNQQTKINDLFYGKEVESFLRYINPDPVQALSDVQAIWREEGLIHPAELTIRLLTQRLDQGQDLELKEQKAAIIRQMVEAGYQKEGLTGCYDAKQNTPLITGLAHLYTQTLNQEPVSIVEGDFSNMGGTNLYFAALDGSQPPDPTDGWEQTNAIARRCAEITLGSLTEWAGVDKVHAVRSGGDEIRLIVAGKTGDEVQGYLDRVVHPRIEEAIEQQGLVGHDHSKHPGIDYRTGFGLALGATTLDNRSPPEIMKEAENRIQATKLRLGYARHGLLPPGLDGQVAENIKEKLDLGQLSEGEKFSAIHNVLEAMRDDVRARKEASDIMFSESRIGADALPVAAEQQASFDHFHMPDEQNPDYGEPIGQLRSALIDQLKAIGAIKSDLRDLPGDESALFEQLLEGYHAIDPVTATQMDRDLPARARYFAQVAERRDEGQALALHVEFRGAAAFNDRLSHGHGDVVLRREAELLSECLSKQGLPSNDIYHLGGGKFVVLLPPLSCEKALEDVESALIDCITSEINHKTLGSFFERTELKFKQGINSDTLIADMESTKHPGEKGISVLCTSLALSPDERGGAQIFALRKMAEQKVMAQRAQTDSMREPSTSQGALVEEIYTTSMTGNQKFVISNVTQQGRLLPKDVRQVMEPVVSTLADSYAQRVAGEGQGGTSELVR